MTPGSASNDLTPGLEATVAETVTEDMTAERVGSGDVPVLATPMVLALVERAAVEALRSRLPDGWTSVGASVSLDHLDPTPVGSRVKAAARLDSVHGRRLSSLFDVEDESGAVARGTHVRILVERDRFVEEASRRA